MEDQISQDMQERIIKKIFSLQGGPDKLFSKYDHKGIYIVNSSYHILANENRNTDNPRMPKKRHGLCFGVLNYPTN